MSAKHIKRYQDAREREPALAAHAGMLSVLAVLNEDSESHYAEREALTRALVREQQRAPSSFWSAALLLAYSPMLLRLRGRICGEAFARDDLDQMVLAAFLEVVAAFPLDARPTRAAMYLRQDTQRAIFRRLCGEQALQKRLAVMAEQALRDEHFEIFATEAPGELVDDDEREELIARLCELGSSVVPEGRMAALIATRLRRERLREYVERIYPELDQRGRETAYQRLKRERLRTSEKLRLVLEEAVSHGERGPALPRQRAPT
jgi:hypothetical protein